MTVLRWINLSLLVLYPVAWFAPLIRAGLLPLFGLNEISIVSGLVSLWETDLFLTLVVTLFAIVAPIIKTLGLSLLQFGFLPKTFVLPVNILGKLAMADIFLIAVYVTVIKGLSVGRIEVAWGLYLFSACVITSLILGVLEARRTG